MANANLVAALTFTGILLTGAAHADPVRGANVKMTIKDRNGDLVSSVGCMTEYDGTCSFDVMGDNPTARPISFDGSAIDPAATPEDVLTGLKGSIRPLLIGDRMKLSLALNLREIQGPAGIGREPDSADPFAVHETAFRDIVPTERMEGRWHFSGPIDANYYVAIDVEGI
jgi:hypothetical protein